MDLDDEKVLMKALYAAVGGENVLVTCYSAAHAQELTRAVKEMLAQRIHIVPPNAPLYGRRFDVIHRYLSEKNRPEWDAELLTKLGPNSGPIRDWGRET